jgi:hypothetical protein
LGLLCLSSELRAVEQKRVKDQLQVA